VTTPTPTGNGDGVLTASFHERAGLKGTRLSDAMSIQRKFENILQQKEEVSLSKGAADLEVMGTTCGGEWGDLIVRVRGLNHDDLEWMET
jgi:hypothetical protein